MVFGYMKLLRAHQSSFSPAQEPRARVRLVLTWALLLCFALGTLAHSGHVHVASQSTHEQCDLCVGFGATMAPPTLVALSIAPALATTAENTTHEWLLPNAVAGLPQARAPPQSC